MERKAVSVRIDPELWKRLKLHAVNNDKTVTQTIEDMIRNLETTEGGETK